MVVGQELPVINVNPSMYDTTNPQLSSVFWDDNSSIYKIMFKNQNKNE